MSPQIVDAALERLRGLGAPLAVTPGQGWRLLTQLQLLDADVIRGLLPAALAARLASLELLLDVDSTNRHLLEQSGPGVRACLAERQSAGRGRRGRTWVSPFASSLYLSLRWPSARPVSALSGFSIAAGVAVAEALRGLGADTVQLKWPNDLVAGGAKLGGLLVEMVPRAGAVLVTGIGVNGRLAGGGAGIDQRWTDLDALLGAAVDRNRLAAAVLGAVLEAMTLFESDGLAPFRARFAALDALSGRAVRVLSDPEWTGFARGLADDGALLVESEGAVRRVLAGDVSVRDADAGSTA